MNLNKSARGFTLVELLVVIAIIAILAIITVLVFRPAEFIRQGNDATRLADLSSIQNAINIGSSQAATFGVGTLCVGSAAYPCTGKSTDANAANANGTGWVKVNVGSIQGVSLSKLPIDPTNSLTNHYTYCADDDNWEVNAVLESEKYVTTESRMGNDGGDNANRYEVGTSLTLVDVVAANACDY